MRTHRTLKLKVRPLLLAALMTGPGCFTPPPQAPGDGGDREATAETLQTCTYIGGYNRYGVRGEAAGMCATLVLVDAPGASQQTPEGLTLSPELGVEAYSLVQGPCTGRAWRSPHEPGRAPSGSVTLGAGQGPFELTVDVRFPTGLGTPEVVRLAGTAAADGPSCL